MTHLSALLHSLSKAAVEVLAGTVVSPQISPGEGFTSKIIWLSKYFDSLWVVGLRTSVSASCWLKEDLISWMCGLFYNLTMSERKTEIKILCTIITEVTFHNLYSIV